MSTKIEIKSEFIELIKLLKLTGLAETGGHAKQMVDEGMVKVDGVVEQRKRCKIRPGQVVEANGQSVEIN